jgi:DNA-binding transcriptional LysR family regulator
VTQLADQGFIGRLDVGIFSSGILNVIPCLLAEFHTARPEVKIGLHNMSKAGQIAALRKRRITIGFNRHLPFRSNATDHRGTLHSAVIAVATCTGGNGLCPRLEGPA